jgi:tryptophan synthase beta chain
MLCVTEGIIPALESSHAISQLPKLVKRYGKDESIIVCLSGRGDKDVAQIKERAEKGEF